MIGMRCTRPSVVNRQATAPGQIVRVAPREAADALATHCAELLDPADMPEVEAALRRTMPGRIGAQPDNWMTAAALPPLEN